MVQHIAIGIGIGLILGLIIGFLLKTKTVIMSSHFHEKLYVERQQALAIAAEANAAYNKVGGRGGKNAADRRIITPADFDAHVGVNTANRKQQTG
jgi:sensor histidine kinase regulating citrate/malate metabolism